MLENRKRSNKNDNVRTVNTKHSYQEIMKITEYFKSIPSQIFEYIKKHDKNQPRGAYFLLVKQLSEKIKDKKHNIQNERNTQEKKFMRIIFHQEL